MGIARSIRRTGAVAIGALLALASPAAAQRVAGQQDAEDQLRSVIRSFYFNLSHRDWEAIAADVLSAKVVASRSPPMSIQPATRDAARTGRSGGPAGMPGRCTTRGSALIGRASIRVDGDWAGVSVPRCGVGWTGADEFRLVRFERRWRFVYIDLFEEPTIGSATNFRR